MEKKLIREFLRARNEGTVVVVQGLGFVGAVTAVVCASVEQNHRVIGIDQDTSFGREKVDKFRNGTLPIECEDEALYERYCGALAGGRLTATWDSSAYGEADVIIVNINLDVCREVSEHGFNYDVDMDPFASAIRVIGRNCKENALIIIETTVPPGTVTKVVEPTIKEELKRRGRDASTIMIGHSYERVMPGKDYVDSVINNYRVYSGINPNSSKATCAFLSTLINTDAFPLTELKSTCASEMAKVLENSFRAMNIGFMVEWSRFAEEAGVNLYEVVDAIRMRPTHQNLMYPGVGVGGYCLPKDPLLASWARKNYFGQEIGLSQSEEAVRITREMPNHALSFIERHNGGAVSKQNVLVLGLSYNKNVGDTRDTPVEPIVDYLISNENHVIIHDPYISIWKDMHVHTDLKEIDLKAVEMILVCTAHDQYADEQEMLGLLGGSEASLIVDTVGVLRERVIAELKGRVKIKVIGRGDL